MKRRHNTHDDCLLPGKDRQRQGERWHRAPAGGNSQRRTCQQSVQPESYGVWVTITRLAAMLCACCVFELTEHRSCTRVQCSAVAGVSDEFAVSCRYFIHDGCPCVPFWSMLHLVCMRKPHTDVHWCANQNVQWIYMGPMSHATLRFSHMHCNLQVWRRLAIIAVPICERFVCCTEKSDDAFRVCSALRQCLCADPARLSKRTCGISVHSRSTQTRLSWWKRWWCSRMANSSIDAPGADDLRKIRLNRPGVGSDVCKNVRIASGSIGTLADSCTTVCQRFFQSLCLNRTHINTQTHMPQIFTYRNAYFTVR